MIIHRAPLEPTSLLTACCGIPLATLDHSTESLTRVDRDVTCKPDELADLGLNDVLRALVNAITGPRRTLLIARLREIRESGSDEFRADAESLVRIVGEDSKPEHGEDGHQCIPPEVLMQAQDALGNIIRIVEGHKRTLTEAGYPEPVVYGMVSNLHAVLLNRLL